MNRIQLKNIKHAAFASEETYCYSASIYFDGKRVGTVKNDGHGGCDYEYIEDKDGWKAMSDYVKTLPETVTTMKDPEDPTGFFTYAETIEGVCHALVSEWLTAKDLKSLLRRCFVWQRENGEVRQCKRRKEHTIDAMQNVIAKTEPTSKLLNSMKFEDAMDIYSAI